jgi:MFS family permease
VIYAIFLMLFLRGRRAPTEDADFAPVAVGMSQTVKALFGASGFLILIVYFTLPAIPGWAVKNWLPTYLATAFNLKQGPAGLSATGYVTFACFVGALLGGILADRAMRFTSRGRIYVSALGTGLCVPALLLLGNVSSLPVAIIGMVLFGLGFGFFDANNMPILCQLVRPQYRATGYGIMNLASIGVGAVFTVALGAMRDHGISLGIAFSLFAGVSLLAGLLILFIRLLPEENHVTIDP